ncbi:unnamed protein product [Vicia faba]|uniref:Uncharacterized protein n=1 Tax=Vicia faba TaxID=3906 RepID=A0AAV0YKI6_VICFA|nr:unnamed protein product [Vicia faba]
MLLLLTWIGACGLLVEATIIEKALLGLLRLDLIWRLKIFESREIRRFHCTFTGQNHCENMSFVTLLFRSQIKLTDHFSNICKVYSLLVGQEKQSVTLVNDFKILDFPFGSSKDRGSYSFRGKNIRGVKNLVVEDFPFGSSQDRGSYSFRGKNIRGVKNLVVEVEEPKFAHIRV